MKKFGIRFKIMWCFLFFLMLPLSGFIGIPAVFAQTAGLSYVTDEVGLLTPEEVEDFEEQAREIEMEYGCGVYAIILEDYTAYSDKSVYECAKDFYRNYNLGSGSEKNGVLLLLSMSDRDYALIVYGDEALKSFTDYGQEKLEDDFLYYFGDDRWEEGFQAYFDGSEEYLSMAAAGTYFDVDTDEDATDILMKIFIIVGIPVIISGIICGIFLAQMKTARKQTMATEYILMDTKKIRIQEDRYTHSTQTRRKIEKSSSSGGTTRDSSGFSGRSGKF